MDSSELGARIGASFPAGAWSAMRKASAASASPGAMAIDALHNAGIQRTADGGYHLSEDAIRRIRDDRIRRATVSQVPSTPRMVMRDAGGKAVRKGAGRWSSVSMETLRGIREKAPVLQGIHSARAAQVRRMAMRWTGRRGDVGWRVVHKDHFELGEKPPEFIKPFVRRFERLLLNPSERYCKTAGGLLSRLEEDLLTINRPVCEKLYSALDRRRVVGFRPVDGAIIWPTQLFLERWIAENPEWYGQRDPRRVTAEQGLEMIAEILKQDVTTADYCLVREGICEATYRPGVLLVAPFENRTDVGYNGYWPSCVEQALEIILTFINTWDYNASFFTRGMMAEFILGISGNVHDDDIDSFVDMLREATQGVRKAWQPPVMPLPEGGTIEKIDLKPANREMMYEVFQSLQIALAAAVYRMDPSTINARPWDGGSSPGLGQGNRNMEIALAKEEGLQGDLQHLADNVLTPLAMGCHPDLRVVFEYGDFDAEKEANVYGVRAKTSLTRNEVRLGEGLEPMGFWVPADEVEALGDEEKQKYQDNPWNMPTDPGFAQVLQQQKMAELQQQQMAMQQQQPEDEEPPPDDGYGQPQGATPDDGYGQPTPQAPFGAMPGNGKPAAPGTMTAPGGGAPGAPPGGAPAPLRKGTRGGKRKPSRLTVYVEDYQRRE